MAGYAPEWLARHQLEETSRATYAAMLKHIVRDLGVVTLADLDAPKVRSFIRAVEATGLSSSTVRLIMTTLGELCRTAVGDKLMTSDPTASVIGRPPPAGAGGLPVLLTGGRTRRSR